MPACVLIPKRYARYKEENDKKIQHQNNFKFYCFVLICWMYGVCAMHRMWCILISFHRNCSLHAIEKWILIASVSEPNKCTHALARSLPLVCFYSVWWDIWIGLVSVVGFISKRLIYCWLGSVNKIIVHSFRVPQLEYDTLTFIRYVRTKKEECNE